MGFLGGSKNHKNTQKSVILDITKIPLSDPITPKFDLWALFGYNSSIFHFGKILKIILDQKISIFTYFHNLLSENHFIKLRGPAPFQFK